MNKNNLLMLPILVLLLSANQAFGQNTILWKVTDTVNNKTSYIVGTSHQFGNSFVDSIPEIKESLLKSDIAIFESIDKVEDTRKIIEKRQSSNKIEKYLKRKELRKLKEVAKDWKIDLYKLKPIEIRWKLQQEYERVVCETTKSTDEFDEFDGYLKHLAKENDIKAIGLETNQLDVIEKETDSPDWKKERKNIRLWIKKITSDKASEENCVFANRYRNFDIDYEFEKECESNYIIFERNNLWMNTIMEMVSAKNTFIAVGYFHLRWKCGLLEQLKNEGFKVEPINIK